jgi:hypothetical protein
VLVDQSPDAHTVIRARLGSAGVAFA